MKLEIQINDDKYIYCPTVDGDVDSKAVQKAVEDAGYVFKDVSLFAAIGFGCWIEKAKGETEIGLGVG